MNKGSFSISLRGGGKKASYRCGKLVHNSQMWTLTPDASFHPFLLLEEGCQHGAHPPCALKHMRMLPLVSLSTGRPQVNGVCCSRRTSEPHAQLLETPDSYPERNLTPWVSTWRGLGGLPMKGTNSCQGAAGWGLAQDFLTLISVRESPNKCIYTCAETDFVLPSGSMLFRGKYWQCLYKHQN